MIVHEILERMDGDDDYYALERLLRQSREIRVTDRQAENRELLDEIVSAQSELIAPTSALKEVSKTLASLGEKREAKARVRFFARFAAEAVDDIEQARELQDQANRDAQRLVADAKVRGDQRVADNEDADYRPTQEQFESIKELADETDEMTDDADNLDAFTDIAIETSHVLVAIHDEDRDDADDEDDEVDENDESEA